MIMICSHELKLENLSPKLFQPIQNLALLCRFLLKQNSMRICNNNIRLYFKIIHEFSPLFFHIENILVVNGYLGLNKNHGGNINKYKARLVAKIFHQQQQFDVNETFSLVVKPTKIHIIQLWFSITSEKFNKLMLTILFFQ